MKIPQIHSRYSVQYVGSLVGIWIHTYILYFLQLQKQNLKENGWKFSTIIHKAPIL